MLRKLFRLVALGSVAALPTGALAAEDYFEFWMNPTVEVGVGKKTSIEFETAQRFRARGDGGRDTYFFRLWVNQKLSKNVTLSGAVEQRWNDTQQEQRLHQQLYVKSGVFRSRSRLEQRFVEGDARMGLRFRQRLGVDVPLDRAGKWSAGVNAEGFFTLQSGNPGGQTGMTGLRTYAGVSRDIGDRLSVSIGYMRAQEIRQGRPDRVGHAPLIGIDFSF